MGIREQEKVKADLKRIVDIFVASTGAIRPHAMITGPSGSGKSHVIKMLAQEADLAYYEINAAQLTREGTSGNSLSKALSPLIQNGSQLTICFVDEFDKLFISGNTNGELAHEITNGVQNEFLRVLESTHTQVYGEYAKYVKVSVDNVLFFFAGAFNGEEDLSVDRLREFGIKTEFLGRVGLIFNLEKLSLNSMYGALQESEMLARYLELFPDVQRDTVETAIMEVVAKVHEKNTLGIRLLHTLINQYFINDGVLTQPEVKRSTFQSKLSFKAQPNMLSEE